MAPSLYLIIELRGDRYAIAGDVVTEVIPYLRVKALPGAPSGLSGLVNYRGHPLPVVDLHLVAFGLPTPAVQSARIIVADLPQPDGTRRTLGVLVPRAHTTMRLEAAAFQPPPISADGARYLGPVLTDDRGVIQRVSIDALLTPALLEALMTASVDTDAGVPPETPTAGSVA